MKKLLCLVAFATLPLYAGDAPKTAEPLALKVSALRLAVHGDSTLHAWRSDAKAVTLTAELSTTQAPKASELLALLKAGALSRLELKVLVEGLRSPEGAGMDKNTWRALESKLYPEITFSLDRYTVKDEGVEAKGKLSIHGVTKDVVLTGVLGVENEGVHVKGKYGLKMSDYGVKPPVIMLGAIKVKDEISIAYDFTLAP